MALLKPTFPQGPQLDSKASWIKYKYGTVQYGVADPGCLYRTEIFHPESESASKKSIFNKKIVSKSRKYDPGCSSRISDPDIFSIPDPGTKKHRFPDPGPQH